MISSGTAEGPLLVPALVLTEVAYLLSTRLGWQPEVRFLGDLASGNFTIEPVQAPDLVRMAELVARYHDVPLGTVDASVVAAAERLGVLDIATLEHRHFRVVRPSHATEFNLLPEQASHTADRPRLVIEPSRSGFWATVLFSLT